MPRMARVVIPGEPHHITQRGNRREDVFHGDADRRRYLTLLSRYAAEHGLAVRAYCISKRPLFPMIIARPETYWESVCPAGLTDPCPVEGKETR